MVDNSKIGFYSNWEIDQLLITNNLVLGSGDSLVYTISDNLKPNTFEIQFQPSGSTLWYQTGRSSSNGTLAGILDFYSYINNYSLRVNLPSAGTVRYFIWADRLNYV